MGYRTQHEGKTERAKESHDRCSQPPGMCMPKTADLGTLALLVVNSSKLHLNSYNYVYYLVCLCFGIFGVKYFAYSYISVLFIRIRPSGL